MSLEFKLSTRSEWAVKIEMKRVSIFIETETTEATESTMVIDKWDPSLDPGLRNRNLAIPASIWDAAEYLFFRYQQRLADKRIEKLNAIGDGLKGSIDNQIKLFEGTDEYADHTMIGDLEPGQSTIILTDGQDIP